jgi:hypothetical protein
MAADRGSTTPRARRSIGRVLASIAVFLLVQLGLALAVGLAVIAADGSRSTELALDGVASLVAIGVGIWAGARLSRPRAT